jgi:hypothetical protein
MNRGAGVPGFNVQSGRIFPAAEPLNRSECIVLARRQLNFRHQAVRPLAALQTAL